MRHAYFLCALLAAEWLIIFRMWLSPSVLFGLVLMAGVRWFSISLFPHYMGTDVIFALGCGALFLRLRGMVRSRFRHELLEIPTTGVPWLALLTRNPKSAMVLEIVICLLCVHFYLPMTPLKIPPWDWQDPVLIASVIAYLSPCGLTLWNALHNRVPKVEASRDGLTFKPVKPKTHKVRLPSVREMMDEYHVDSAY